MVIFVDLHLISHPPGGFVIKLSTTPRHFLQRTVLSKYLAFQSHTVTHSTLHRLQNHIRKWTSLHIPDQACKNQLCNCIKITSFALIITYSLFILIEQIFTTSFRISSKVYRKQICVTFRTKDICKT